MKICERCDVVTCALLLIGLTVGPGYLIREELHKLRFDLADGRSAVEIGGEGFSEPPAYSFFPDAPGKSRTMAESLKRTGTRGSHFDLFAIVQASPWISSPSTDWMSES